MTSSALICEVGGSEVCVAVDDIAQIVDFDPMPLPLAQPWVRGLGVWNERVFVCVGLSPASPEAPAAGTTRKGLLMKSQTGGMSWGIEIDAIRHLSPVSVDPSKPLPIQGGPGLALWLLRGTTPQGSAVSWVDTSVVARDLAGHAPKASWK